MPNFFRLLIILIITSSCKKTDRSYTYDNIDFKEEMRQFVISISDYAKSINSGFEIVTQNGAALITENAQPNGAVHTQYIRAIDGQAQEGLFFGYEFDNEPTPVNITMELKQYLDKAKAQGKQILVTDYCYSPEHIQRAKDSVQTNHYLGFVATRRELNIIPPVNISNENNENINHLSDAKNFLYLINYNRFPNKELLLQSLENTNYDILILDLFYQNNITFTPNDINRLKIKANGGSRLVISYLSIGEAESYRYYWQNQWNTDRPIWLDEENPEWPGNYKVRYWEPDWQNIIYGNNQSYLKKIIDAGFDGAYLDIIDAYEYFEEKNN